MFRVWLFLSLLLLSPVNGGLWPSTGSGDVCVQSCRDDDERGRCAPDCTDCICCSHVRPVVLASTPSLFLRRPPRTPPGALHDEQEPPSAETGDIFHVPIAPLA